MTRIETELRRLPEPRPPATLLTTVMARVSREADAPAAGSAPPPGLAVDVTAGAAAVAGLAIVCLAWGDGVTEPAPWLAFGLLVYWAGLLAPLRESRAARR